MATTKSGAAKTEASADGRPIEDDIAELRAEIAALARQISALGEKSASTARRAAAEGVEQLRAQGEAKLSELRDSAADMEARITQTVHEKPVTSLAIAAGIGFLFALIARR